MILIPSSPIPKTRVVSRVPEIIRLCSGKKTLHLGCADMPYVQERGDDLLHMKLAKVINQDELWGLDSSEEGCRLLRAMGFDHVIHGDVERISSELFRHNFDILLVGEIIEHLANPGIFIKNLTSIMNEKTELLITTPNAFAFKQFLYSMIRREKVHNEHNFYFSYRTLKQCLKKSHLRCKEIYYYQNSDGPGLLKLLLKAISIATRISPVWADGLIARAVL